jgi:acyl-coenzyme A thioesterase 9
LPDGVSPTEASNYGLYLVTAAVDRMDVLRPLANEDGQVRDLRLSGHVSYATESSLEVFMRLSTLPVDENTPAETILLGRFAMACRATAGGKQKIAQLEVEGQAEEELWRMGKEMREVCSAFKILASSD